MESMHWQREREREMVGKESRYNFFCIIHAETSPAGPQVCWGTVEQEDEETKRKRDEGEGKSEKTEKKPSWEVSVAQHWRELH